MFNTVSADLVSSLKKELDLNYSLLIISELLHDFIIFLEYLYLYLMTYLNRLVTILSENDLKPFSHIILYIRILTYKIKSFF